MRKSVRYRERFAVPRWWHACTPVFGVLIGGEMVLTDHLSIAVAIILGITALAELFLWSIGRAQVIVDDGRIRAGSWRLPLSQVRGFAVLSAAQMREEMHRRDPNVYRCTAPWIREGILLDVDDPDDVPLWLLSARDADTLAAALVGDPSSAVPVA